MSDGCVACRHARLHTQVVNSYVDSNPNIKWCPRPGCNYTISLQQLVRDKQVPAGSVPKGSLTVRCACGHAFCWNCLEDAHDPASCEQVRAVCCLL